MSNLSTDIDNLRAKYREVFLKTNEEFNCILEKIKPEELLKFLNEDILKEIYEQKLQILEQRKKFSCAKCGACCKLACSEFSYGELKRKAESGDNFAGQFISVFIPYENYAEAQKIYPEYFELLVDKAQSENVYFYHCPKVTDGNCCPDYEARPQICKDFPDNALGFLPQNCGYVKWKEEVELLALKNHAMLEIVAFYKSKIAF